MFASTQHSIASLVFSTVTGCKSRSRSVVQEATGTSICNPGKYSSQSGEEPWFEQYRDRLAPESVTNRGLCMATLKLASRNQQNSSSAINRLAVGIHQSQSGLLSQQLFLQELGSEQRRSERSGRAFLLVLISGEDLLKHSGEGTTHTVTTAISSCIRETDVSLRTTSFVSSRPIRIMDALSNSQLRTA